MNTQHIGQMSEGPCPNNYIDFNSNGGPWGTLPLKIRGIHFGDKPIPPKITNEIIHHVSICGWLK